MIELKYLSIGNALLTPMGLTIVKNIAPEGINGITTDEGTLYLPDNILHGIKCVPEVLKQFGFTFVKDPVKGNRYFHDGGKFTLYVDTQTGDLYLRVNDGKVIVNTVHQLQNISLNLYNYQFNVAEEVPEAPKQEKI